MNQNQLVKIFLSSLLAFQFEGYVSNSKLEQHLKVFETVLSMDLQFPKQLSIRLFTVLVVQFRKVSKLPTTSEADMLHQGSVQKGIEEYLLIKYVHVLELVLGKIRKGVQSLTEVKELLIVLVATLIDRVKTSQAQYLLSLLHLLSVLLETVVQNNKQVNLVETIFPNVVSNLFNLVVQFPLKSHKVTNIVLNSLGLLIAKLFESNYQIVQSIVEPASMPSQPNLRTDFRSVCLKKLEEYLEIVVDNPQHFENISSVKVFIQKIVQSSELDDTLLSHLANKLAYLLELEEYLHLPNSLCQLYLYTEAKKHLKFLNTNKNHFEAKLTNMYYNFSLRVIGAGTNLSSRHAKSLYSLLKPLFRLSSSKVKLASSYNYSLLTIHSESILNKQLEIELRQLVEMFSSQFLRNNVAVFENQLNNQNIIQKHIGKWNHQFCEQIVQCLIEDMESVSYSTTMSVTSFKKYLESVIMLRELVSKLEDYSLIQNVYSTIRKSECLNTLQPSNEEEEFLIAFSYDILRVTYEKLLVLRGGFKRLDLRVEFLECTVSLFTIQNNTITTYCNYHTLKHSQLLNIGKHIYPLLPTLVHRNQHNIIFIEKALELCATEITTAYAQHIYQTYNNHSNSEKVILTVLPSLSTETIRKAVLSISTKHRWIDALSASLQNLNNRPLSKQQSDSFNPNDQENAVVKNCLGVVLIEIESRFNVELQTNSSRVVDLFIKVFETNPRMIFCSKLHEYFPLLIGVIDCESANRLTFSKVAVISKVLKLMSRYLDEYRQEKMAQILKHKPLLTQVFERLDQYIERKIEIDEAMKEVLTNLSNSLREVCLQLFKLDAERPLHETDQ